jgi:hypothetical protein
MEDDLQDEESNATQDKNSIKDKKTEGATVSDGKAAFDSGRSPALERVS